MQLLIGTVLDLEAVVTLRDLLSRVAFEDGRLTAGWSASAVKQNEQAAADPAIDMWRDRISGAIASNALVKHAALPKRIIGPMFSRYRVGDRYGTHVDEPILDGARADLSFTLFLSEPDAYDGGELVIEGAGGEDAFKEAAGSLVLYPSGRLHRVSPVTRGERLAAVGWVRSRVRDPQARELLFDLETARQSLYRQSGKTAEFDLLSKCHANLIRMWADD